MTDPLRHRADRPPWAWRLVVRTMVWFLGRVLGWRLRASEPATVPPPDQPLVVVFNHTSYVDAFLVAAAVWRRLGHWVRPLAKAELFDVPLLNILVRQGGSIPVVRGDDTAREAAYDAAVAQLHEGGTILIAPEGTTTHDGSLLPLRHGAARLALEAGVDVLVVTHFGAQRGFSPVATFPERGAVVTMTMDVLTPWPDEDAASLTGRIAATMMDRSEELRDSYPQAAPEARWWPPYARPASPTETARENLERYRQSMAETIAQARARMAQMAEEHEVEQRLTHARERASAVAEEVVTRSRERADSLTTQLRERAANLVDQDDPSAEQHPERPADPPSSDAPPSDDAPPSSDAPPNDDAPPSDDEVPPPRDAGGASSP